ncbi:hypothetical protein NHH03_19355 [Stieleria sp. TO1_6]|uniref:hypothetical protein n=1 Tax=Stieleria tagensis TaxID=2956795 RepID=UPI00209AFC71|nr:hypothetical protein [Stieleria tagensis]MCO8123911.1 hypothetical protein [Stieleria tagensis]
MTLWPTLAGRRVAFRDVSHFYLPLYDYVAQRTANEWLPMWNPLDHTGMPLVGESTTAVLYPLRYLVYAFPLENETALSIYLALHVILAAASAAWLARRVGIGTTGVVTAALVYSLSGSVFSLCCNPPFLVGAAWLPLALGACLVGQGMAGQGSTRRRIALAGFAFAMMVLGGDPQSALHCVIVVIAVSLCRGVARWVRPAERSLEFVDSMKVAAAASVLALGLASIQIAASLDWSRHSDRVLGGQHSTERYDFSLAPWHALETLSMRPFGHPFPINRQLSKLIPGDGRMWTPSIYAGLVVGLALFFRLLAPQNYFSDPWLSLALVSLLLCFGHFGAVWLLQQIPTLLPQTESAIGGPYWLLCQIVPGYTSFRYPVKWLPLFAIASSLVAGQWIATPRAGLEWKGGLGLLILFVGGCGVAHWGASHETQFRSITADEYWGPLQIRDGFLLSRMSWMWSGLMLVGLLVARGVAVSPRRRVRSIAVGTIWLLIAADVGINAYTLLPRVDVNRERQLAHQASPAPIHPWRTLRTQSGSWPDPWKTTASQQRALEVAASERMAWFGRWHLAERRAVFNSMVSIRSKAIASFWPAANQYLKDLDASQQQAFWDSVCRWLAIDGVSHVDGSRGVAAQGQVMVYVDRWMKTGPRQQVRVFRDWKREIEMPALIELLGQTQSVPLPHVNVAAPQQVSTAPPQLQLGPEGQIDVKTDVPCLLERCFFQDGHWQASLTSNISGQQIDAVVHRSSHLNQAVLLPAGDWRVEFFYRPWWLWPTIGISFFTLVVWVGMVLFPNHGGNPVVR